VRGLSLVVDRTSSVPPWSQLRDAVVRMADAGELRPGERLPTVRGLAASLDLAPGTVARAYRELEAEGWLVGRGRAGTFVADVLPVDPAVQLRQAAEDYLRRARALGFGDETARRALGASIAAKKSSTEAPT
jgi:DNA-binding transcriptional regulator YhcF (GntR family)